MMTLDVMNYFNESSNEKENRGEHNAVTGEAQKTTPQLEEQEEEEEGGEEEEEEEYDPFAALNTLQPNDRPEVNANADTGSDGEENNTANASGEPSTSADADDIVTESLNTDNGTISDEKPLNDSSFASYTTAHIMKFLGNATPTTRSENGSEKDNDSVNNDDAIEVSSQASSTGKPNKSQGQARPGKKTPFFEFIDKLRQPIARDITRQIQILVANFEKRIQSENNQTETNFNQDDAFDPDHIPGEGNEDAQFLHKCLRHLEQRVRVHPCWRDCNETEWENTVDSLERFVVRKIYNKAFAPTEKDKHRDAWLKTRIERLNFLHLGNLGCSLIPSENETNRWKKEFQKAAGELNKINKYLAPRDKLVCILNCCRVVQRILRRVISEADSNNGDVLPGTGEGADDLIPALIYTVVTANPENLLSNIEFIGAYRNPIGLRGEFGYFFTMFTSAVGFIQGVQADSLTGISEEEFRDALQMEVPTEPTQSPEPIKPNDLNPNETLLEVSDKPLNNLINISPQVEEQQLEEKDLLGEFVINNSNDARIETETQTLAENEKKMTDAELEAWRQEHCEFADLEDASSLTLSQIPELLKQYKYLANLSYNNLRKS